MDLNWTRWGFYLAVGPPFLLTLFLIRSRTLKTIVLLFMLIFIEGVLLSWRPLGYIAFSLTGVMGLVMIASLLTRPAPRTNGFDLVLPWVLFIGSALIGLFIGSTSRVSNGPTNLLYFQAYYLEGLLFFWIGRTAVSDGVECQSALRWLIYFGAAAALVHFFTVATGYTFYASTARDMAAEESAWRYGALFANPNTLADFYAVLLPVALVYRMGWARPSKRTGLLILVSAAVMLGSLGLTGSRGGTAVTFAALLLGVVLMPIGLQNAIGVLLVAGITSAGAYLIVTNTISGGFSMTLERFQSRGVADVRYEIWSKTLESIWNHPFGIGLDPYIYGETLKVGVNGAHNIYLEMGSQIGIIGLISFLWIVGVSMLRLWQARSSTNPHAKTAATALFVGLVGFLMGGLVEPIYHNGLKFQRIFWILVGIASTAPVWAGLRKGVASESPIVPGDEPTDFPSGAEPAYSGRRAS